MIEINDLINAFSRLPGIGKKSATRIVYYLLKNKKKALEIASVINEAIENIKNCHVCGNYTLNSPCEICRSSDRDDSIICIVEEPKDMEAIEATGLFKGKYHILMGNINPLEGATPDSLRIKELLERIKLEKVREILIATNPTTEGEATFLYIQNLLSSYDIKLSRLATGIPMGGTLEYTDKVTLSKALLSKQTLNG
jgi:recombination protein RecR